MTEVDEVQDPKEPARTKEIELVKKADKLIDELDDVVERLTKLLIEGGTT